jgi:hypothetical protein
MLHTGGEGESRQSRVQSGQRPRPRPSSTIEPGHGIDQNTPTPPDTSDPPTPDPPTPDPPTPDPPTPPDTSDPPTPDPPTPPETPTAPDAPTPRPTQPSQETGQSRRPSSASGPVRERAAADPCKNRDVSAVRSPSLGRAHAPNARPSLAEHSPHRSGGRRAPPRGHARPHRDLTGSHNSFAQLGGAFAPAFWHRSRRFVGAARYASGARAAARSTTAGVPRNGALPRHPQPLVTEPPCRSAPDTVAA